MATKPTALELLDHLIAEIELSIDENQIESVKAPLEPLKATETVNEVKPTEQPPQAGGNKKSNKESKKETKPPSEKTATSKAESTTNITVEDLTVNSIDLRVGIIRNVKKHETAEKLYCEEIDIGEESPRAIASGLVPYYSLEQMQNRKLIVVANLKPRNLVGFKSNGMVLCASKVNEDGSTTVEFVDPPASSQPGDRIVAEGLVPSEPLTATKADKLKAFEVIAADLRVDSNGFATWKGHRLVSLSSGEVTTVPTVRDAPLK